MCPVQKDRGCKKEKIYRQVGWKREDWIYASVQISFLYILQFFPFVIPQTARLKKHGASEEGSADRGNAHGELASTAGEDVTALGGLGSIASGGGAVVIEGAVDGERADGRIGGRGGRRGGDGAQSGGGRSGSAGLGRSLGGGLVGVRDRGARDDLDALPGAALVTVLVLGGVLGAGDTVTAHVVLDLDALVEAVEGALAVVGDTAGPLNGALGGVLATGNPGAELDLHGGLGEGAAALLAVVLESADDSTVDDPVELGRGPLDGVGVELVLGVSDGRETTAVVGLGATLAEVVGLNLGVVAADPLPIDLVEVIGLKDEAGDNTLAEGGPHGNVDLAEEDVAGASNGRSIGLLLDGVDGAKLVVILDGGADHVLEEVVLALGEVDVDDLLTDGLVIGAGWK